MVNWPAWFKKIPKFDTYEKQLQEVLGDISDLGTTFLDVGCGEGRFIRALEKQGKKVDGLDLHYNNFDLTKDKWPAKKYDIVFANLTLITIDLNGLEYVTNNMIEHSNKYVYVFDEFRPEYKCCEQVDEGKWKHDPANHIKLPEVYRKTSEVNKVWTRFLFEKK